MRQSLLFSLSLFSINLFAQEVTFVNGDGALSIGTQSNRTAGISLIDIDALRDLDALVANGRHWAEQNFLYYNDGRGNFKSGQPIGEMLDASYSIQAGDFNSDGHIDIAIANDKVENKLYLGSAKKTYKGFKTFGNPALASRHLEVIDVDGDGDLDLIISNRKGANEICLNDGKGNFDEIINFGKKTDQTIQTKIADINDDGFLDLITAERQEKIKCI